MVEIWTIKRWPMLNIYYLADVLCCHVNDKAIDTGTNTRRFVVSHYATITPFIMS